jgi:hypothetical protein
LIEQRDRYRLSEQEIVTVYWEYIVRDWFSFNLSDKVDITTRRSAAGFETISTTLKWWTLAMVTFPKVQRRAQAELDTVVGRARLPTFANAPRPPYVRAVIKEALRWRPAVERGEPHKAVEDDRHEGMSIPKGATGMANRWHCSHDRAIFGEDADNFKPERHLDIKKEEVLPGPRETNGEGHAVFGFGRQIYVGKHLANDSLFLKDDKDLMGNDSQMRSGRERERTASGSKWFRV